MNVGEMVRCKDCNLDIYECVFDRRDEDLPHCTDFKGCGDIPNPGIYTPIECPKCGQPLEIK